jgi:preprotein translocase subunit SecY
VLDALINAFRAPDIRRRILFVLGILVVYRLLAQVPLPGVDHDQLKAFFDKNTAFGIIDLFAGGGLSQLSVVGLAMNPYINASIIMQLMTGVIPSLSALSREGEYGRNKINQYTRYLSVPMAMLQAYGFLALLNSQGVLSSGFDLSNPATIVQIATLTAGSISLMWLGELLTEKGIATASGFIIFAGIVSRAPTGSRPCSPALSPGHPAVRRPGHRRRRGDHLHPGGPAADPDPIRQPSPRQADVPGWSDVPAAAGSTSPA